MSQPQVDEDDDDDGFGDKEMKNSNDSSSLPTDSKLTSTPTPSSDLNTIVPSAYSKILVPHDNTEMSDMALGHPTYLANVTGAEISILFVMEKIEDISGSSFVGSDSGTNEGVEVDEEKKRNNEEREGLKEIKSVTVTAHGEAKKMIEEKLNLCNAAGVTGKVSYRLTTGKSVEDEIVNLANSGDADLIVMTSSTISASIRSIGSIARKVIDNVDVPVMIIHR